MLYTIGFTKTSAEAFFERLVTSDVKRVIDVRLHNTSQLAGFAKSNDLTYFLKRIGRIDYCHLPLLAPEESMLNEYKKEGGSWSTYEARFMDLMSRRNIESVIGADLLDGACLLCSEKTPHKCHRRLVCEYLNGKWGGTLQVKHL
jgi:uncharacterized protein (DUF488 family)